MAAEAVGDWDTGGSFMLTHHSAGITAETKGIVVGFQGRGAEAAVRIMAGQALADRRGTVDELHGADGCMATLTELPGGYGQRAAGSSFMTLSAPLPGFGAVRIAEHLVTHPGSVLLETENLAPPRGAGDDAHFYLHPPGDLIRLTR